MSVPPYTGQNQTSKIAVPAPIAYKYIDPEEGPWVMPPYANFYPPALPLPITWVAFVPPPIYRTDLFSANQRWPL